MPTPPLDSADLDHIAAHTTPLWDELRNQRLFITGGTGFFGCWLLESFAHINCRLNLNAHATVLTRDTAAFTLNCPHLAADPAIALYQGDVRNFIYPDGDFRYLIHAATEASAKQQSEVPGEMSTTILEGTAHTLQFAAIHNTQKLLFTSSGAVYGPQPSDISHIPETYPLPTDPTNVYAEGKRTAEKMCTEAASSALEIKIARCFTFVGPHLPLEAHFAIGNFLRDALADQPIQIAGDGTPLRSYLYAADLAIWLWTILFRGPSLQPINVGSEEAISIASLARTTTATLNSSLTVQIAKQPNPNTAPIRYVPSTQSAQKLLGLKQRIPLDEAIRRTAAWHTKETRA